MMSEKDDQVIIAIGREFGSGGKEIAGYLSAVLDIPVYEKNILKAIGIKGHGDIQALQELDEAPRSLLRSRTIKGYTNSNEDAVAAMQFQFLEDQAKAGKSFIVLGHCAEEVLKEFPALVTIFISADDEFKIKRTMKERNCSREEAKKVMKRHDKKRKSYHNYYCTHKWGDSRYFELCMRSDILGTQASAAFLLAYIQERKLKRQAREAGVED